MNPRSGLARGSAVTFVLLAAALAAALFGNDYQRYVLGLAATLSLVGSGLNVMMGLTGQISLGHAGFFALGAYAAGILATQFSMGLGLASVAAVVLSGAAGVLLSLPALRVRGPYLAMVTIAFGFVIEQAIADWKTLTGGWNGLVGIPMPAPFGEPLSSQAMTLIEVGLAFAAVPAFEWLRGSRWGLIMRATRSSEVAARSLGVNLVLVRSIAFGLSAAITGLAGALFAASNSFISPESFPFFLSITFVLIVLIGGEGHAAGPIFGAALVVLLPESLASLAEYRLLFFGVLLLIVLRLLPQGLGGLLPLRAARGGQSAAMDGLAVGVADEQGLLEQARAWLAPAAPASLVTEGLLKRFGGNVALADVSITVPPGEITALIGPNGAGKTTFINLACGFYPSDAGSIRLGAADLTRRPMHVRARTGLVRTFQTTQLFDNLSVLDNVRIGLLQGRLAGSVPADAEAIACGLLREAGYAGDPRADAGSLAHVDRRLVELARALATRPIVLLLDEPAAGLSRGEKDALVASLQRIASHRIGVFLIEHDMGVVMGASSRIHVMDAGRPLAEGSADEIAASDTVRRAYLGDADAVRTRRRTGLAAGAGDSPASASALLLEFDAVDAGYGAVQVLRQVAFGVGSGSVTAILGPNGAGKSTVMRVASGLLPAREGQVRFKGQALDQVPAQARARQGLVLVPEGRQVFGELSVEDNIRLGATACGGIDPEALEALFVRFPLLAPLRHRAAGLLSGGEQQVLALARGLAAKPELLLLDEPTLGLAPAIAQTLFDALHTLADEGLALVVADQMSHLAVPLADEVLVLSQGVVAARVAGGEADAQAIEAAYFGRV
jgi:ABC-type branched-subunit amino acid transport system ATPase component/ABC-type branched-subunit amino acid transport system permease subunit